MNSEITSNVIRFILLVLVQVLVFKGIEFNQSSFKYVSILIYPLFIMLLPVRTPPILMVALGFLIGITIDIAYDSLGVHAGASVFTAFIRSFILNINGIAPREGYEVNASPYLSNYGALFFFLYAGIFMFLHLLVYFSLEIFTPVYWGEILLRTIMSFFVSMIFIMLLQFLFNIKTK